MTTKTDAPAAAIAPAAPAAPAPVAAAPAVTPAAPVVDETEKAATAALKSRLEAAEATIAKMQDEREESEFISKAKALNAPGVDVAKLGRALRKLTKADAQAATDVTEAITGLVAQIEANGTLNRALGSSAGGAPVNSAEEKLAQKAKDIHKANPKLTKQQAYAQALSENPDLYAESLRH